MQDMTSTRFARREFLASLGVLAGATALGAPQLLASLNADAGKNAAGIPQRVLGRTGAKITILGLGTAPIGHSMPGPAVGVPVYRAALEAGINYVDTARIYDDAETYLGELLPEWRDKVFLTTKSWPEGDDAKAAATRMQKNFEQSLRLLKTDHVDLLHVHNAGQHDPAMLLASGGPLEFAKQMKDKGLARFIGITGHIHNLNERVIRTVGRLQRQIQKVRDDMKQSHQLLLDKIITPQGFGALYNPAEQRLNQLLAGLPKLEADLARLKVDQVSVEEVIFEARNLYEQWPKLEVERKRAIVESTLKRSKSARAKST